MESPAARDLVRLLGLFAVSAGTAVLLGGCAAQPPLAATRNQIIISVKDQKLTLVREDHTRETFPISTSKFGLGDRSRSYTTPTGELAVAAKIGAGAKAGTVFHGRVSTGEVVGIDAPGRDAIVTRILALKGLESSNSQAYSRGIYIHGTPEERNIGRPTSYGCIRMRSRDVITLFDAVRVGARVQIIDTTQNQAVASNILTPPPDAPAGTNASAALERVAAAEQNAPGAVVAAQPSAANMTAPANVASKIKAEVPAPSGKKVWAGAPSQLLAKQAQSEARAKQRDAKPPVGAPTGAQHTPTNSSDEAARTMNRSVFDAL